MHKIDNFVLVSPAVLCLHYLILQGEDDKVIF